MDTSAVATNKQTAQIFLKQKLLPAMVVDELVSRAQTLQEWIGQVAVDDGLLTAGELASALASELGMAVKDLRGAMPSTEVLALLPAETCRNYCAVPLGKSGNTVQLAVANPLDKAGIETIRRLLNAEISPQLASITDIATAIDVWYSQPVAAGKPALGVPSSFREPPPKTSEAVGRLDEVSAQEELALDQLLEMMMANRASDLHLAVGSPPMMRVDGELQPMPFPVLKPPAVPPMVYAILTDIQVTEYERRWELDFAYSLPGVSRFRVNVHRQRGSMGAVFRTIPEEMPTLAKLGMPPIVRELTLRPRGLVLVTGPTGSGKSTTLAAMIDEINRTRRAHVVTIEDPIEFLHRNNMCVITQREVGADTEGFATALRHVLRQDPDVILIGEMRDLETVSAAVTAAETGHLVFATLHTSPSARTIERIIDVFPSHQQDQMRSQLSNVLEGVLTQTLLPNIGGRGRSCALEVLVCTDAIRNLIREAKIHQIPGVIQASAKYGMQSLDMALKQLVLSHRVSVEEAIRAATNPDDFKALLTIS